MSVKKYENLFTYHNDSSWRVAGMQL